MSNILENKLMCESMRDVANVHDGYKMYVKILSEKMYEIFEYENLPIFLPYKEIESRLLWTGFCGIFNHKKYGVVCSGGSIYGIDLYYHATNFTYTQPILGSDSLRIGKNCVVIYNSFNDESVQTGCRKFIERYARQLADVDSSISISMVNHRASDVYMTRDEKSANRLKAFFDEIKLGRYATIMGKEIGSVKDVSLLSEKRGQDNTLTELLAVKRDILANFYEEIGVQHKRDKVAEMTAIEVGESDETLLLNQQSMLEQRIEGVGKLNEMFDLNVRVKIREGISL